MRILCWHFNAFTKKTQYSCKKRCFLILHGGMRTHIQTHLLTYTHGEVTYYRCKNYRNGSQFAKLLQKVYCDLLWTTVNIYIQLYSPNGSNIKTTNNLTKHNK